MTNYEDFGLSEIGQIALTVRDLDRATAFYRDLLGMQFLFQASGMAFFQCGSVRLLLGASETSKSSSSSSILYYKVADINAVHATLSERGVEFERDPLLVHRAEDYELWLAFFRDGDGNRLALMSEVATR